MTGYVTQHTFVEPVTVTFRLNVPVTYGLVSRCVRGTRTARAYVFRPLSQRPTVAVDLNEDGARFITSLFFSSRPPHVAGFVVTFRIRVTVEGVFITRRLTDVGGKGSKL